MSGRSVAEIFSESSALEFYLLIESALARAQAETGIVPPEAAKEIKRRAVLSEIDLEKLRWRTATTGYPIAPLVRQLAEACGEHGRWVHWGATTQDILNTTLALQVNESWKLFSAGLHDLIEHLITLTERHRHVIMVARTFGGHALPITFGFKTAVWLSAVLRHFERFEALRQHPLEGEFAGVAGTLASLDPHGPEVRKRLMELLKLPEPVITWSAMRDRIVERVGALVGLTATLAKILQDVAELSSTEIAEVAEPSTADKDASSALPFKSNPVLCALAAANATMVVKQFDLVVQASRQREERSGEGLLEFEVVPLSFSQAKKCLDLAGVVLGGLRVFPDRMRANLQLTHGIILAERYMMALAPKMGRLAAHDLIHELCRKSLESGAELGELLADTPAVVSHVDRGTLLELGEPAGYLGDTQAMIDAVLDCARNRAEEVVP